jgi:hypothetical protein
VFKILGILVCVYTVYAAVSGRVFAKSGAWGRTVSRQESPEYFWIVIVIYACLGVALGTMF